MKMYVYDINNNEVVAVVTGETNEDCEAAAESAGYGSNDWGWTYSPAFGVVGGLVDNNAAELIKA